VLTTALAFAPRNLGGEGFKALAPKAAKLIEPRVHFLKGRRVDGIDTARPIGADSRKPALAQNLKVLRHGCLRNAELPLDHFDDSAGSVLTSRENLKDTASNRVAENVKGVH
jgi:hypothetical protein